MKLQLRFINYLSNLNYLKNYSIKLLIFLISATAFTQEWTENQLITPTFEPDFLNGNSSLAMSGEFAFVGYSGEPKDEVGQNHLNAAGAVLIYKIDENGVWNFTQKLVASDRAEHEEFGNAVAASGNTLMVGAWTAGYEDGVNPSIQADAGAVYFFEKDVNDIWVETQKIIASDVNDGIFFGYNISLSGHTAVASRWYTDDRMYIFEKDIATGIWSEVSKWTNVNPSSLAVRDDIIVAGNLDLNCNSATESGGAYVFERDGTGTWNYKMALCASDSETNDGVGFSVDIGEDLIILGASGQSYDENGLNYIGGAGAAYLFEYSNETWTQTQKLVGSDRSVPGESFGSKVLINNDYIIVSAKDEDQDSEGNNPIEYAGAVYLFNKNASGSWIEEQKIVASDRGLWDSFGERISSDGDNLVVTGRTIYNADGTFGDQHYFFKSNSTLNINNEQLELFSIYPNPVKDKLIINLYTGIELKQVNIFNNLGQYLYSANSNTIITNNLNSGLYFLEIETNKGVSTKKIIIE